MEQKWKKTLYSYVNSYNTSEIEHNVCMDTSFIVDEVFLKKKIERMNRLYDRCQLRETFPCKSETKVKIMHIGITKPEQVVAQLQFQTRLNYQKKQMHYCEQRIEKQKITLVNENQSWIITKVELETPDCMGEDDANKRYTHMKVFETESLPFLNKAVLGHSKETRENEYRRDLAVLYADQWWDSNNPSFESFSSNCTNYVSQCLLAGAVPIDYTGRRDTGWWYKGYVNKAETWSYSWAVTSSLHRYLINNKQGLTAIALDTPDQLSLGDVILYDWDGDGNYQHATIVTAFDDMNMPLVNAHTVNSRHRYWDYKDSYAWTDQTVYRFFHINDQLY